MKVRRGLERELEARDTFLAEVAAKLEGRILSLANEPSTKRLREGIRELAGFARELRIIAEPKRPVPLERTKLDLVALTARLFSPTRLASRGAASEVRRRGAIEGQYDAAHIETILGELVSNAMKYGGAHPVTPLVVRVAMARKRVCLVVENEGSWSGLGRGSQPLVFGRFVREETRREVKGFGVGLWLVTRLAKAHGGSVQIANVLRPSERGEQVTDQAGEQVGVTRVTVRLPFERADADAEMEAVLRRVARD